MSIQQQIARGMNTIVLQYAKYSKPERCFLLEYEDIPVYEIDRLVSECLEYDMCASEACGPDNPEFGRSMLPALIDAMRDYAMELANPSLADKWTSGVRRYFERHMRHELEYALNALNTEPEFPEYQPREGRQCESRQGA